MGILEILKGRVKIYPRQSLGTSQHIWDNQKRMIKNNRRILWKQKRTQSQMKRFAGQKRTGSIVPNAMQRLRWRLAPRHWVWQADFTGYLQENTSTVMWAEAKIKWCSLRASELRKQNIGSSSLTLTKNLLCTKYYGCNSKRCWFSIYPMINVNTGFSWILIQSGWVRRDFKEEVTSRLMPVG